MAILPPKLPPEQIAQFKISQPTIVDHPMVIIFRDQDGEPETHIHPCPEDTYAEYGIIICDLVRHVARCYGVAETAVWQWVDAERNRPTAPLTGAML